MRRALLLGGLVFAMHAATAAAVSVTVNCAELQTELNKAVAGETITLDEVCKSGFPYELPAVPITLAGTAGAGFSGGSTVQLEGGGASVTIQGLAFENAKNTFNVNGGGLYITPGAPIAVSLEHDLFRNDVVEGSGAKSNSEGGGAEINNTAASVSVSGSTFTGDKALAGAESSTAGGGLTIYAATAMLSNDTFTGNVAAPNGFGGGLWLTLSKEGGVLSGSQFSGNAATDEGGGAVISSGAAGGVAMTLTGDTFTQDVVADPNATSTDFNGYAGGGLSFVGFGVTPTTLIQSGDVFDSNSVSFKAAPRMSNGGGEAIDEASVDSVGDRFTNNSLQPPDEAEDKAEKNRHVFGWGGGLSVIACGDLEAPPPTASNLHSTFSDAVVAGDTLLSGPSANGAGIYVGVLACPGAYAVLELADSTVSGNTISGATGPVAGIDGGPHDALSLTNTIVDGDAGGPELGGFNSLASVSASYSDVCSGAAPFAGAGNICADPKLLGAGPGTADVHETLASPTLEAGSNALVPPGITTDAYGGPRILGSGTCRSNPPAIVDIGAAEFVFGAPLCPPPELSAPKLSALGQSAKRWREGRRLAQISVARRRTKKKLPIGTTYSFKLDRAATVTFRFTTSARGRRLGKRCVAQTHRNKDHRACTRTVTAGTMSFAAHAGSNKVSFDGVIAKHKRLAAGKSYKLLVTATASGPTSPPGTLQFTIAR